MQNENQDYIDEFANKYSIIAALDDDILLTPTNISIIFGVHKETVRRWCRNGYLKSVSPFGRYKILGSDFKTFAYQWYRDKNN